MTRIAFTWSTRREGNSGYVLEESETGIRREYGPMPAHIVPAFVNGRRRIVALEAEKLGASYEELEDFSYMEDPPRAS